MLPTLFQSFNTFTYKPFKMTDQPTNRPSAPQLPGLSDDDFVKLSIENGYGPVPGGSQYHECLGLARAAYRRGADDQLEACIRWLKTRAWYEPANSLVVDMRPSLKVQALAIIEDCNLTPAQKSTICEALEALPE